MPSTVKGYKPEAPVFLGTFEVTDDSLLISDPSYALGTWCTGVVEGVRQGTWNAYVACGETSSGRRCWELIAMHDGYPETLQMTEKTNIDVGVDSGQAGIFSVGAYNTDSEAWYGLCCEGTSRAEQGIAITGGCVSSAGFGDGSYECFIARDGTTKTVGVKIVFINDDLL